MVGQLTVMDAVDGVDGVKDVGHGGVGSGGNAAKKNKTGFHGGWSAFLSFCVLLCVVWLWSCVVPADESSSWAQV
jgi:hypothetical protein